MPTQFPGFSTKWYYNSDTGAVQNVPTWVAAPQLHAGLGWHGPFDTKQDALDYYERNKGKNPGWKAPSGLAENFNPLNPNIAPAPVQDPLKALGVLFTANVWIRVAEFAVGVILLAIGGNALVKQATGVDVAGTGRKIGKVATRI